MKNEYFIDNINDETLVNLIDGVIKLEKNKKQNNIKSAIFRIIPIAAAIVFVIGLVNILPVFVNSNTGAGAGSEGIGQPDVTIFIDYSNNLIVDDDGFVTVENTTDEKNETDEKIGLFVPPIIEKSCFEEQILANLTGRDYEKFMAYYTLKDLSDPNLTDEEKEEMLVEYPICKYYAVYVCDPHASERELLVLLGALKINTTLLGEDLIQMYIDYDIPYKDYDLFTGESLTEEDNDEDFTAQSSNEIELPNYGINITDDGTQYLVFKNESLYAALMEYFGMNRWHGDNITLDMLNQINSIDIKVKPEYNYLYDDIGLREEFNLDCKYIEYTINGKTLDILPEKFMEGGVLEGHKEMAELDINQYFDYESGYYITKTDLSLDEKLMIYKTLAWGGAVRTPVERNEVGDYYTTFYNASPSIYLLGFPARYYDKPAYDIADIIYMPNLHEINIDF